MDRSQARERLLQLLIQKSFRTGRIVLSSGKISNFYVDCKQTALSAEGHTLVGQVVFELVRELFPGARAVGGPTLGADPLISAASTWSALHDHPLDAFIIRKDKKGHGTGQPIEGLGNLGESCPVVVIEDVVTTAGSTLRSVERCREAGLDVLGVIALVDREEGGRAAIEAAGLKLEALYDRSDFPIEEITD